MKKLVFLLMFTCSGGLVAQIKIHSHNDYAHDFPLSGALSAKASSIEVDVILLDSILYIAHEFESIDYSKTLQSSYIEPLLQLFLLKNDRVNNLYLLIDLKTEAYASLEAVIKAVEPIIPYTYPLKKDGIRLVISGNRPEPKDYLNYSDYIFFDCQEIDQTPKASWSKVAMISQSFKRFSNWKGNSAMAPDNSERLNNFIAKAKNFEKPLRLWATPDTPLAWSWSIAAGLDFINTDQPIRVREFIEDLK